MKLSEDTKKFINKLKTSETYKSSADMILNDINKFKNDITNMILNKSIELEGSWSNYILSDINILYEEDMLKVSDMLNMYGIKKDLPALKSDDVALICTYQFTLYDVYDNVMGTINMFHVTIKGAVGDDDYVNEWFILYDKE